MDFEIKDEAVERGGWAKEKSPLRIAIENTLLKLEQGKSFVVPLEAEEGETPEGATKRIKSVIQSSLDFANKKIQLGLEPELRIKLFRSKPLPRSEGFLVGYKPEPELEALRDAADKCLEAQSESDRLARDKKKSTVMREAMEKAAKDVPSHMKR